MSEKKGATPKKLAHAAQYFREGWAWECECGAGGQGRTKADVVEQYREHRARGSSR